MAKKIPMVFIANEYIVNPELKHQDFALYVGIRMKSFTAKDSNTSLYTGYAIELEDFIDVSRETLNKHLQILFNMKMITGKTNQRKLEIQTVLEKPFVGLKKTTIEKIMELTKHVHMKEKNKEFYSNLNTMAIRLYYYYVKNYNKTVKCAYPSYQKIYEDTTVTLKYISIINNILEMNGLLYIDHGKDRRPDNQIRNAVNRYIPLYEI